MASGVDGTSGSLLFATGLALGSAGLHATWNLLVKTSADRFSAAWGQFLFGGLVFLPVLVAVGGVPGIGDVWPLLVLSACVHTGYLIALVRAYTAGDFSLSYPLARGTGALLATIAGIVLLGDHLDPWAWLAIAVVLGGLVALVGPAADRATVQWALLTGCFIASYTIIDSAGARESEGFPYGMAVTLADAAAISVVGVLSGRGPRFARSARVHWRRYLLGGICATVAYSLVLVAVRHAPVGYVAVLRESSIIIGAYIGWVALGERLGGRRLAASAVVTAGMALLVVLR
jgi:drug/metabolite transporter (DMT)-like permease